MEQIYTIPVNEAFEASASDASCGCPLCTLYRKLEENELELILGASMMEPDVRIQTNREGFCRLHYDMMFVRKNRLGMALTLESHLKEMKDEIRDGGLGAPGARPVKRIAAMEESCTMDVVAVKGAKNMLLGGEGIFNTVVRGPGKVILQTMPISKVAELLTPFFSNKK